jgi:hypothetical protein
VPSCKAARQSLRGEARDSGRRPVLHTVAHLVRRTTLSATRTPADVLQGTPPALAIVGRAPTGYFVLPAIRLMNQEPPDCLFRLQSSVRYCVLFLGKAKVSLSTGWDLTGPGEEGNLKNVFQV